MSQKIIFAQQLRGVAALLVVVTHYFGVYWGAQEAVAYLSASPSLHMATPPWTLYFDFPYAKGPFGVALFFLVSGFVIPFSLQARSLPGFLLGRVFRIYPTYLFCLMCGMLAVWLSSHYWRLPFPVGPARLLSNALLLNNLSGEAAVDGVNWTLAIEIKFYLLAALMRQALLRARVLPLLAYALLTWALNALAAYGESGPWNGALAALASDLNYISYMLIGVLFYQHLRGLLTAPRLILGVLALAALFCSGWKAGAQREQYAAIHVYYLYALAVFCACYLARGRFRSLPVLDFFADISYPLYALHSLLGYVLLKMAMDRGLGFSAAVCLVLPLVVLLAYAAHKCVELGSTHYGKRLAARL